MFSAGESTNSFAANLIALANAVSPNSQFLRLLGDKLTTYYVNRRYGTIASRSFIFDLSTTIPRPLGNRPC